MRREEQGQRDEDQQDECQANSCPRGKAEGLLQIDALLLVRVLALHLVGRARESRDRSLLGRVLVLLDTRSLEAGGLERGLDSRVGRSVDGRVDTAGDLPVKVGRADEGPADGDDASDTDGEKVAGKHLVVAKGGVDGDDPAVEAGGDPDPASDGGDESDDSAGDRSGAVALAPGDAKGDGDDGAANDRALSISHIQRR